MNLDYSITVYFVLSILLCKIGSGISMFCFSSKKADDFQVEFRISTRSKLDQRYTLNSDANLRDYDFSPRHPTAVIIHGFLSSHECKNFVDMRDAFLKWEDMNVITVNWNKGCSAILNYAQAVANTETAGIKIKDFIRQLAIAYHEIVPIDEWGHFHFVGHSLGAHVAGQAAARLKKNNIIIHRITGLDPALPCFKGPRLHQRLNISNALFVDVIHTNGNRYGIFEPMGHVDFYPHGGKRQPGCSCRIDRATRILPCHHNRAVTYFTESLMQEVRKQCTFLGQPWNMKNDKEFDNQCPVDACRSKTCLTMGIKAQNIPSSMKNFFVSVTKSEPYCNKC